MAKRESEVISVGWKIGAPSLKLNNAGVKSKNCGDFGSVAREALEEREGHDPDIDRQRADLNYFEGFRTAAELQEYSRKHVDQLRDAKGRKLRTDAVVMCVTILKPPAAYMATLAVEDQRRFLDDANEVFAEIVGRENIKSRADHFDELGAHSHVFWEPMTADGRLCAKDVHNIEFFGRVNRELPQKLRAKGWAIEDCDCYDTAKKKYETIREKGGRSSMAFKADAEKAKQELETELTGLEAQAALARQEAAKAAERASAAVRDAEKAEQELERLDAEMAAVRPPEAVRAIIPKKSITGKVQLTKPEYEILRKEAETANHAVHQVKQLQQDNEQLRQENAQLQKQIPTPQERTAALATKKRVQALEKEVAGLRRLFKALIDRAVTLWEELVQPLRGPGHMLFDVWTFRQAEKVWSWTDPEKHTECVRAQPEIKAMEAAVGGEKNLLGGILAARGDSVQQIEQVLDLPLQDPEQPEEIDWERELAKGKTAAAAIPGTDWEQELAKGKATTATAPKHNRRKKDPNLGL